MEPLDQALKFKQWTSALSQAGCTLNRYEPLYIYRKGKSGEILFAFLKADLTTPEKQAIPPAVLLRGQFVSVLVCFTAIETQQRYLLLVKQRRIANGQFFYEHPAGMADGDDNPRSVALKELTEETGLTADESELIPLSNRLLYSSPGLLDEGGWFFAIERTLSLAEIMALHQKATGEQSEHEFITLEIVPFEEASNKIDNLIGLVNLYLYRDFVRTRG